MNPQDSKTVDEPLVQLSFFGIKVPKRFIGGNAEEVVRNLLEALASRDAELKHFNDVVIPAWKENEKLWEAKIAELTKKLEEAHKVIEERGYAFQEAQTNTLIKLDSARDEIAALRERNESLVAALELMTDVPKIYSADEMKYLLMGRAAIASQALKGSTPAERPNSK